MVLWQPIAMTQQLVISGGRVLQKQFVVETAEALGQIYVKAEKNSEWLRKVVCGPDARKGALSRSKVIETLRAKTNFRASESAEADAPDAAVAAVDPAVDPMLSLAPLDESPTKVSPTKKARTTKRARAQPASTKLWELRMPRHYTVDVDEDSQDSEETLKVRVYRPNTSQLMLHQDDIFWLIEWLRDELDSGGVAPLPEDDDSQHLQRNSAHADVHIRWAFDGAWEATYLSGPQQGASVKSYVDMLTAAKWDKVCRADGKDGSPFEAASQTARKQATRRFLELHLEDECAGAKESAVADSEARREVIGDVSDAGGSDVSLSDAER